MILKGGKVREHKYNKILQETNIKKKIRSKKVICFKIKRERKIREHKYNNKIVKKSFTNSDDIDNKEFDVKVK